MYNFVTNLCYLEPNIFVEVLHFNNQIYIVYMMINSIHISHNSYSLIICGMLVNILLLHIYTNIIFVILIDYTVI